MSSLTHSYDGDHYHQDVHSNFKEKKWKFIFSLISFNRYILLRSIINPNNDLLEIGAGPGWNVHWLKSIHVTVVEPSSFYDKYYSDRGIRVLRSLNDVSRQFSQILLSHVLEHIESPLDFLKEVRSYLTAGGNATSSNLIIFLPDESSGLFHRMSRKKDQHLYCFNPVTISNLLQRAGFKSLSIRKVSYGYELKLATYFSILQGLPFRNTIYRILLRALQLILLKSQWLIIACPE